MRNAIATMVALSALATGVMADFNITVSNVPDSTRSSWCSAEYTACSTLCGSTNPSNNTCDPGTLVYNCTCANGSAPGLQYYENTMPWYLCEEAYAECINSKANDLSGQQNCKKTIQDQCGTLNISDANVGSDSSSTTSATASATGSQTSASNSATSTSHSGAAPTAKAVLLGNGVAAVAAGVFAAALL